jgi:hypothetical protein
VHHANLVLQSSDADVSSIEIGEGSKKHIVAVTRASRAKADADALLLCQRFEVAHFLSFGG